MFPPSLYNDCRPSRHAITLLSPCEILHLVVSVAPFKLVGRIQRLQVVEFIDCVICRVFASVYFVVSVRGFIYNWR